MKSPAPKEKSSISSSPRDTTLMNTAYSQLERGRPIKITRLRFNEAIVPDVECKFKIL